MAPATEDRDDVGDEAIEQASSAERRLGIVAGSYRLTRHIGSGGSSHVFEAEHVRLGKRFAVKLLRPELDPNHRTAQRFRREARAIARLQSEHIVSVIDCGELDDGTPYLVMELLEGEDLRSLLNRERSLPARRVVPLIIEACRGLSVVHAAGLVHRDLKPENLFIARRGTGEDWCKVLDFGVAKMDASLATVQGAIVGTLRYMAPEQLEATSDVGPATDTYALGAILYECLTGEPAHPGETAQEVMYSVMNRATPDSPLLAAKVPPLLIETVMSCLAKTMERRPRNTAELLNMLSQHAPSTTNSGTFATVSEDDAPAQSEPPKLKGTPRTGFLWGAGFGALAAMALVWSFRPGSGAPSAPLRQTSHVKVTSARAALSSASAPEPVTSISVPAFATTALEAQAIPPPGPSAGVATRSRRAPAVKTAHSGPLASARPPHVAVGSFDSANPYGE